VDNQQIPILVFALPDRGSNPRSTALEGSLLYIYKRYMYQKIYIDNKKGWKIPKGNQNMYIEEQTTQWPKEKVQKDKQ
jgi:hypothetical protein